jgi:hypothetical protein
MCESSTTVCNDNDSSNSYHYVDIDNSNGMIPQAAYAQQNEVNPPLSSSSVDSCASDQLPASIDGKIRCMGQGECYSEQFEGKEVKHCNFMMSGSDE